MKKAMIAMIRFYQRYLSPLKRTTHCIFTPTCSQYAVEAIEKYGPLKGGWLTAKRLLRCNPFNRNGGYDPVP
ncbi:MAG: membrane protein insertion efficiency factor YidD [Lachnospiraceae bacterium]|nr:membrane protein insertion efficiency factor YidD [Lachnospiraceae bacterium]